MNFAGENDENSEPEFIAPNSDEEKVDIVQNENIGEFSPIYITGTWETQNWEKKSGTARNTDDHKFSLVEDGRCLELTVVWPESMIKPELLLRRWIQNEDAAIKVEGVSRAAAFRDHLRSLRKNTGQKIQSKCRIPLLSK